MATNIYRQDTREHDTKWAEYEARNEAFYHPKPDIEEQAILKSMGWLLIALLVMTLIVGLVFG